jgi:hypothetical protein
MIKVIFLDWLFWLYVIILWGYKTLNYEVQQSILCVLVYISLWLWFLCMSRLLYIGFICMSRLLLWTLFMSRVLYMWNVRSSINDRLKISCKKSILWEIKQRLIYSSNIMQKKYFPWYSFHKKNS